MVVSDGRITEQFAVEDIVPPAGSNRIAPVEIDPAVVEIHTRVIVVVIIVLLVLLIVVVIFPFVETEEQAAATGKLMVDLGIDIIEIVIIFLVLRQKRPCH